jgi:hypothetical protein
VVQLLGRRDKEYYGDFPGISWSYEKSGLYVTIYENGAIHEGVFSIYTLLPYTRVSAEGIGIKSSRSEIWKRLGVPTIYTSNFDGYWFANNRFGIKYGRNDSCPDVMLPDEVCWIEMIFPI